VHTHPNRPGHPVAGELTTPDLPVITAGLKRLQESQTRCLRGEVTGPDIEAEFAKEAAKEATELALVARRWRTIVLYLRARPDDLSPWERAFLNSIRDRGNITPKQVRVLARINDGKFGEVAQ
jgi:hypothetical protein